MLLLTYFNEIILPFTFRFRNKNNNTKVRAGRGCQFGLYLSNNAV